jgi:hypothetical protein
LNLRPCGDVSVTYDDRGNVTFLKDKKNNHIYYFYDDNGIKIRSVFISHDKDGNPDVEIHEEFNEHGDCVHYKTTLGFEEWTEYDANYKKISSRKVSPNGVEVFTEYGERGNIIKREEFKVKEKKNKIPTFITEWIHRVPLVLFFCIIITTLWEKIDIAQFGAPQPSVSDSIVCVVAAVAIATAFYYRAKLKND